MRIIKPIATEKTVKLIELENTMVFEVDRKMRKPEIKKEIEEIFNVKVENIRVVIRQNKKYVYAKLKKEFKAIDLATKLGVM
ncbi:MAG: 50S ribosomal protein L23 [Nanoarchaeota archaeon]